MYARGNGKNNLMTGEQGKGANNRLFGAGGDDVILGSAQTDDYLSGQNGDDWVQGGGAGQDFLYGGDGDDVLTGGNHLWGGDGSDWLEASAGLVSTLDGGFGDDVVVGGRKADALFGGGGADVLTGGRGGDRLTGSGGGDRFTFDDGDSSAAHADRITDFSHQQGDRIDLSAVDAIAGGADDSFTFIGAASFGGHAGELRFAAMDGGIRLLGDVDGDGRAEFVIELAHVTKLVVADLLL